MSALPQKADMCSAQAHVRYVPIADIQIERGPLEAALIDPSSTRCRARLRKNGLNDTALVMSHFLGLFKVTIAPDRELCLRQWVGREASVCVAVGRKLQECVEGCHKRPVVVRLLLPATPPRVSDNINRATSPLPVRSCSQSVGILLRQSRASIAHEGVLIFHAWSICP